MDIVKEWVSNLFILIIMLTFTEILLPENSTGKYVKFIFSLVIMTAVIYPIIKITEAY